MPDPFTAATIATLILTKVFEKQGDKAGEKVWEIGEKAWERAVHLLVLLRRKAPDTARAIEKVASQPTLAGQQPADFGEAKLIDEIEQLAASDPEVKAAVETLAALAKQENAQVWTIENWKGINIKGGTNIVSDNTLNFN